ncbi:hypothetical protein AIS11_05170 [Salmonella enterica]|uniref:hypothetical protein n=1 Tax=Salmonella enterica TaxID=28901 RepID=UPI00126BFE0C|nr:hypothetical protein [Salmonella enterica]EDN4774327.1 hypothetical protein [Salmonella enterica subsp. enterica serovar Gafsa]EEH9713252.1 hypothetical protein [Salmonella enterica subsp. enterica serovar Vancouver]HBZ2041598.1 hypothetical protein [Salmonella enterica subsp. enterica]EBC3696945.1 hypothetical protein [Salmonella enterica]EBP7538753.1 hypothetical protein [Salmonella enterica]
MTELSITVEPEVLSDQHDVIYSAILERVITGCNAVLLLTCTRCWLARKIQAIPSGGTNGGIKKKPTRKDQYKSNRLTHRYDSCDRQNPSLMPTIRPLFRDKVFAYY